MEEPTSTRRSVLGGLGTATLGLGGFWSDSSPARDQPLGVEAVGTGPEYRVEGNSGRLRSRGGDETARPPDPGCLECESTGEEQIVVWIWHTGTLDAAEIVASYTHYMLCQAWGGRYDIRVRAVADPMPFERGKYYPTGEEYSDLDRFIARLENEYDERAKDANLLLLDDGGDVLGGGSYAVSNKASVIAKRLDADCVTQVGRSAGYEALAKALHEVGHCFGLDHEDGGYKQFPGRIQAVTPMQATYSDNGIWTPELHDRAKAQAPEVAEHLAGSD